MSKKILIADSRPAFVKDVQTRIKIDEELETYFSAYLYSNNKVFTEFIAENEFDGIAVSSGVIADPEFTIPSVPIFGYLERKDTAADVFGTGVKNIGFFNKTFGLLDFIDNNIDDLTAAAPSHEVKNTSTSVNADTNIQQQREVPPAPAKQPVESVHVEANTFGEAKFCANCGSKLDSRMKFCTSCGTPNPAWKAETPNNQQQAANYVQQSILNHDDEAEIARQVALDLAPDTHKCKIITTYSAKGGVGKTTISSSLAVYLAMTCTNRRQTRVCIVDYNIDFGDVMTTLGFSQQKATMLEWALSIEERIENGEEQEQIQYSAQEIEQKLQKRVFDNGVEIYALLAPVSHADSMLITEKSLYVMIDNLKSNGDFDYIICDTGNNTRDSSFIALEKADNILMICTQDVTTTNCNDSFLKTLAALDFDTSKIAVVTNNIAPSKETGVSVKDIEEYVHFPCIARIRRNNEVIKANNMSIPLVFTPSSQFTKEIANIAAYVVDEEVMLSVQKKKRSLFSKKKKR